MKRPKLHYISLMRLPTEKAHGLQIMQNCEAFAAAGNDVTLWVSRRWNTVEMRQISDPYAYYGVERNFKIRPVPMSRSLPAFPGGKRRRPVRLLPADAVLRAGDACSHCPLPMPMSSIAATNSLLALLSWLKPKQLTGIRSASLPIIGRGTALQRYRLPTRRQRRRDYAAVARRSRREARCKP